MEILNRNSRFRAKWRVVTMAAMVLLCNGVILWATVSADRNFGVMDTDEENRSIADRITEMKAQVNHAWVVQEDLVHRRKEMKERVNGLDNQRRKLLKQKKQLQRDLERLTSQ